jgi:hypothetical protein
MHTCEKGKPCIYPSENEAKEKRKEFRRVRCAYLKSLGDNA